jgi:hypothetical protein
MSDPLTEVRFWAQIIGDARRTIMCSPDNESRIKCWIDARGMSGVLTVEATPFVADDTIYVLDVQAANAAMERRALQDLKERFRLPPPPPLPYLAARIVNPRDILKGISDG